jgi:RNA polymerase sigma-70 factor (ECF subfamily)
MAVGRGRAGRSGVDVEDEALIRSLYNEHGRALLAYVTRLTGDRAAAEDVVQETVVRAWRHPEVLVNGRGSVRGWLLTVARNIVVDRVRARAARPTEVEETAAPAIASGDIAETVVNSMVVTDAMEALNDDQRAVIELLYFQRRTVTEAASLLGVPAGTVKSRSYYALRIMRERLEPTAQWGTS